MKKVVKGLGYALLAALIAGATAALYIQVTGIPRYTPRRVDFTVDVTPGARRARPTARR